jgi:hypothetical protein
MFFNNIIWLDLLVTQMCTILKLTGDGTDLPFKKIAFVLILIAKCNGYNIYSGDDKSLSQSYLFMYCAREYEEIMDAT